MLNISDTIPIELNLLTCNNLYATEIDSVSVRNSLYSVSNIPVTVAVTPFTVPTIGSDLPITVPTVATVRTVADLPLGL